MNRTPLSKTLLASAARTATVDSGEQNNVGHRGVHIIIDVTAIAATPSVVFDIQGKDPASGKWYTILASAAITGVGTTVLALYPGIGETANVKESDVLPAMWRVNAVHGDADSITYSVGANLLI